ncbi:NAD(P)-binding domain [Trinorchestia longiramus]|nr:NAD(P)-binding domain [Trinorchestia longiramus]
MSGKIVVYGGRGALGSVMVKHFKELNYWVGSIDLVSSEDASLNITVDKNADCAAQSATVLKQLAEALADGSKIDAFINVAGGWAGGNAASDGFISSSMLMWQQSVWSSIITAQAAAKFLKPGGLVVLPGAHPALEGTAGMMGYGMAKAAVHQLTKSLAGSGSGMPEGAAAVAILPITLDTPMNRKWMSKADFSKWTPLDFVAKTVEGWVKNEGRPASGSLVQLITQDNVTQLKIDALHSHLYITTSDRPTPALTTPNRPTPALTAPDRPTPALTTPDRPTPALTAPNRRKPALTTPDGPTPALTAPDRPTPALTAPETYISP